MVSLAGGGQMVFCVLSGCKKLVYSILDGGTMNDFALLF